MKIGPGQVTGNLPRPNPNFHPILEVSGYSWLETSLHQKNNPLSADKSNPIQKHSRNPQRLPFFSKFFHHKVATRLGSIPTYHPPLSCTPSKQNRNWFSKTLEFEQFDVVNPTFHREPVLKFSNKNSRIENEVICF